MSTDRPDPYDPPETGPFRAARSAEEAVQDLCRATLSRPSLTPSEVDVVLGSLSAAVAALPQACVQLSDILEQAKTRQILETDEMATTDDPALAVDTARLNLVQARDAALRLHKIFEAARAETSHIISHASLDD